MSYSESRLKLLKNSVKNLDKLPSNWVLRVLGFSNVKNSEKNDIIKNTKMRLLKRFVETRPLPKNWENKIRIYFSNINQKNRNVIVNKIKKEVFVPHKKLTPNIPTLKQLVLKTMRRKNNQNKKPYINVGNRKVNLSVLNMMLMKSSAKNIARTANEKQYYRLVDAARSRGVQLHGSTISYYAKNRAPQSNKTYLNRMGMMYKIYKPHDPKYRRIVSDVFSSVYKLLHMRNNFNRRGLAYPPLYFEATFPGERNNSFRRYNLKNTVYMEMETIEDLEDHIKGFKKIFMNTPILHISTQTRRRIWNTIEDCKGNMASCIKKCNEIYYGVKKSPRRSVLNFNI